jgi:hypothetical protein
VRYKQITHPYVAVLSIDPVDFRRLQRLTEDQPELTYLDCDDSQCDCWVVRFACASEAVASAMEDGWG